MNARTIRFVSLVASMACVMVASAQGAVSSDFSTGLDGWNAIGFEVVFGFPPSVTRVANPADIVHSATTGNPGGYARLTDAVSDPGSFASAPAKFLGNLLSYKNVGSLSFDHRLFATGTPASGIESYNAFIISGSPNNFNFLYWDSPGPAGPTGWVHFDVPINTTEWSRSPLASMTFDQILSNVTEILLPFELVDNDGTQNQEHGGLDNVNLAIAGTGDFNGDHFVDAADFTVWRDKLGNPYSMADYNVWKSHFGQPAGGGSDAADMASTPVPESSTIVLLASLLICGSGARRLALVMPSVERLL